MATNLRLRGDAEDAVRAEAERTGRTQQDVIRDAIDTYLGLSSDGRPGDALTALVSSCSVRAPRTALRTPSIRIELPKGLTSLDLLDRDDR